MREYTRISTILSLVDCGVLCPVSEIFKGTDRIWGTTKQLPQWLDWSRYIDNGVYGAYQVQRFIPDFSDTAISDVITGTAHDVYTELSREYVSLLRTFDTKSGAFGFISEDDKETVNRTYVSTLNRWSSMYGKSFVYGDTFFYGDNSAYGNTIVMDSASLVAYVTGNLQSLNGTAGIPFFALPSDSAYKWRLLIDRFPSLRNSSFAGIKSKYNNILALYSVADDEKTGGLVLAQTFGSIGVTHLIPDGDRFVTTNQTDKNDRILLPVELNKDFMFDEGFIGNRQDFKHITTSEHVGVIYISPKTFSINRTSGDFSFSDSANDSGSFTYAFGINTSVFLSLKDSQDIGDGVLSAIVKDGDEFFGERGAIVLSIELDTRTAETSYSAMLNPNEDWSDITVDGFSSYDPNWKYAIIPKRDGDYNHARKDYTSIVVANASTLHVSSQPLPYATGEDAFEWRLSTATTGTYKKSEGWFMATRVINGTTFTFYYNPFMADIRRFVTNFTSKGTGTYASTSIFTISSPLGFYDKDGVGLTTNGYTYSGTVEGHVIGFSYGSTHYEVRFDRVLIDGVIPDIDFYQSVTRIVPITGAKPSTTKVTSGDWLDKYRVSSGSVTIDTLDGLPYQMDEKAYIYVNGPGAGESNTYLYVVGATTGQIYIAY